MENKRLVEINTTAIITEKDEKHQEVKSFGEVHAADNMDIVTAVLGILEGILCDEKNAPSVSEAVELCAFLDESVKKLIVKSLKLVTDNDFNKLIEGSAELIGKSTDEFLKDYEEYKKNMEGSKNV